MNGENIKKNKKRLKANRADEKGPYPVLSMPNPKAMILKSLANFIVGYLVIYTDLQSGDIVPFRIVKLFVGSVLISSHYIYVWDAVRSRKLSIVGLWHRIILPPT